MFVDMYEYGKHPESNSAGSDYNYFRLTLVKSQKFEEHPGNPKRPKGGAPGTAGRTSAWAKGKHVFFMPGFTADAVVGMNEHGKAFRSRQNAL